MGESEIGEFDKALFPPRLAFLEGEAALADLEAESRGSHRRLLLLCGWGTSDEVGGEEEVVVVVVGKED